ncbi:MAG TPA: hypothetical protein VJN01_05965, partial [Xanthomonadales bacterium]|nr:hypothetical protein [Xanthomonadales bacterium]
VAELRSFSIGLARIEVTLATRNGAPRENLDPAPTEFRYEGFRFDQGGATSFLYNFDEVWCFGHWPGNGPPNKPGELDPLLDKVAQYPQFNPLSDAELAVLTRFMNDTQGGVFATGDHHLLGASMCWRIPRVSTMRRWLVRDGVPTLDFPTNLDTGEDEDAVPQPVDWVPEHHDSSGVFARKMPHPIFCHPKLGPIDLFPDHIHEGYCNDPEEPGWLAGKGAAKYDFNGLRGDHYPRLGEVRPLPKVIAWGRTLGQPRRVPLVVVYDGYPVEVGRVVVDSTWHHWFNMNLDGLAAAPDQVAYRKILRYFVNVAIWLAKPGWRAAMTLGDLKATQFDYFGLQNYSVSAEPDRLGIMAMRIPGTVVGPCWVRDLAVEVLATIDRQDSRPSRPKDAEDYVLAVVIGEIVKELFADSDVALEQLARYNRIDPPQNLPEDLFEIALRGAKKGLSRLELK